MRVTKAEMSVALDAVSVRETGDGFLAAQVRCARTGVQVYKGRELGVPEMAEVRVYRPEEEVFHTDSLHTYAHRPVTNEHPSEMVSSKNWRKYAVGQTGGEVARDGQFVVVPMVLMDDGVIRSFKRGKKQLSLGYTTDIVWDSGTAPDGQAYDAIQRNIRANHLAVVAVARGGSDLKIGDNDDEGEPSMTTKMMTVDSVSVEVTEVAGQVIARAISTRDTQISTLTADLSTAKTALATSQTEAVAAKTAHDSTIVAKDAEIATLKKQLEDARVKPEQIDAMVAEKAAVVEAGRKLLGDKLVSTGKTAHEIRRQVVDHVMGDAAKSWGEEAVSASFNTLTKHAISSDGGRKDPLAAALGDAKKDSDEREKEYEARNKRLNESWRGKSAAA